MDLRLQRLTGLERDKIMEEHRETVELIAKLRAILADEKEIYKIIVDELKEIKKKYGDERRTQIVERSEDISIEDMIVDEDMAVTISHDGYIKRNPVSLYRAQRRGGKGKIGTTTKEEDFVEYLFIASMHSYILFFTTVGKVYWIKVHELPQASRAARGKPIVNLLNLEAGEKVSAFLSVREFQEGRYIVFATKNGLIKKTELMAYANPRASGIRAIGLEDRRRGDRRSPHRRTTGTDSLDGGRPVDSLQRRAGASDRARHLRRRRHEARRRATKSSAWKSSRWASIF